MSLLPLKTAISDVYPAPDNNTARVGFAALWDAVNEATEKPELDLASAATIDLGGQLSTKLRITGTTGITSFGTTYRGPIFGRFAGILTLTHNATTLILPGGANLTTSAGGTFIAVPKATVSGTHDGWIVVYASDYLPNTALASSRVKGLIGAPNATTPLTKYDLAADEVVLRNSTGGTVARYSTGTIANDLGLAGSAANGRDQSAAFTASSWIYLYFIWNGTTLATISSTAVPTTGPTLPTGYTHWAFATVLRWDGSSNIVPVLTKGSNLIYDIADAGVNRVSTGTRTTSMVAVSLAGFVPPNAMLAKLAIFYNFSHSLAGFESDLLYRPTGSANAGMVVLMLTTQVASVTVLSNAVIDTPVGTSQQVDFKISAIPNQAHSTGITVLGFKIPNGDA